MINGYDEERYGACPACDHNWKRDPDLTYICAACGAEWPGWKPELEPEYIGDDDDTEEDYP